MRQVNFKMPQILNKYFSNSRSLHIFHLPLSLSPLSTSTFNALPSSFRAGNHKIWRMMAMCEREPHGVGIMTEWGGKRTVWSSLFFALQIDSEEMIEIFWNRKLTRESKHFFYHSIKANCWKAFCFVVKFSDWNTFSVARVFIFLFSV